LRQARSNIAREEDNAQISGLRDRTIGHFDAAIRVTDQAIRDATNGVWCRQGTLNRVGIGFRYRAALGCLITPPGRKTAHAVANDTHPRLKPVT